MKKALATLFIVLGVFLAVCYLNPFRLGVVRGGSTFTATTCNPTDVQTAVNLTVDGDTVIIPSAGGPCRWTTGVTSTKCITITGDGNTPNNLPSQQGPGVIGTVLYDQINNAATPMINFTAITRAQCPGLSGGNFVKGLFIEISSLSIQPCTGSGTPIAACTAAVTNGFSPINGYGFPDAGGAPWMRLDNLSFTGWTTSTNGTFSNVKIRIANFYGVMDHSTCDVGGVPTSNGQECINAQQSNFLGVPTAGTAGYGDNSWAQPYPGNQDNRQFYLENNILNYSQTETEFPPTVSGSVNFGQSGGCRIEYRFNINTGWAGTPSVSWHGTDTAGRPRQGCQAVDAFSSFNCANAGECGGADLGPFAQRDGNVIAIGNLVNALGGATNITFLDDIEHQRTFRNTSYGRAGGSVYDALDSRVDTGPFTVATGGVTGQTITITTSPWSSGAFTINTTTPGPNVWLAWDSVTGATAFVTANTANTITIGGFTNFGLSGSSLEGQPATTGFHQGDDVRLTETTLYSAGTSTSSGSNVLSSSQTYTSNQFKQSGAPYSLCDVTIGFCSTIFSNTVSTFTYDTGPTLEAGGGQTWALNDVYVITRAQKTLDDPSQGQGTLMSAVTTNVPVPYIPNAILDPTYLIDNAVTPGVSVTHLVQLEANQGLRYVQNRDYYVETLNQTAQTTSSSPFSGATGTGYGTLARRPATCTTGVAYFATDQGSWNLSGGTNIVSWAAQGELFQCSATNVWSLYYVPYTYPHPMILAGGGGGTPGAAFGNGAIASGGSTLSN